MDILFLICLGVAFYAGLLFAAKKGLTYDRVVSPLRKAAGIILAAATSKNSDDTKTEACLQTSQRGGTQAPGSDSRS